MATLQFKGKSAVWNHHLSVPYHTLEKDEKKSLKGADDSENLIIEGDNLLALKALLPQYQGRVKCIYIDPPYNTGNEGWVYSDSVSSPMIKDWLGKTVGKEGEDLVRHDKWLCMMTPRLKLLRELLTEDGVIFVSIDENEVHHLRGLMDEIFDEANFRSLITWQKKYSVNNNQLGIAPVTEYILVYSKTASFRNGLLPRTQESIDRYKNPDNDPRGPWKPVDYWAPTSPAERPNLSYTIKNPNTGLEIVPTKKSWKYSRESYEKHTSDGKIWWGSDGKSKVPALKLFLSEVKDGLIPSSLWLSADVGHTDESAKELQSHFDGKVVFDTPKPSRLIRRILEIVADKDAIVLDSFAGSGTTAEAVLDQNKEDGGTRKFILVEMEDYANKVTAERARKVIKENKEKDGFTYYSLGPAIDAESLLEGKLPKYNEFAKYVYYLATGENHPDEKKIKEKDGFVGSIGSESIWLLYKQDMEALKSLAITLDWAQEANKKESGRKVVYAPACYLDGETLDQYNIKFVSIPYNLFERQS
jgi:adenine-specific DNA-methyltransferase